ncbi:MAG TPA: prephenate dehydratase [Chloroflexota bacterium]|jgi:chorismate mutase/prephenate dehydratase|nr:prephenate dehydratase [Chloroflexota bacterium]
MRRNMADLQATGSAEEGLAAIRQEIDDIDRQLIALLNRRAAASVEVARIKRNGEVSTYIPSREQEVLQNVLRANPGPLTEAHIRAIYGEILSASRSLQRPLRIAYLGPEGTNTHRAAETAAKVRFGSFVDYVAMPTVEEVFAAAERGNADYGVVPVENSSEGSVGQTLDLFVDSPLKICAEILLRITHHLVGRGPLTAVRRVYSHPQALAQCRRWLRANLPQAETLESNSTSAAVALAAAEPHSAAIGSQEAAAQHGLPVLASAIQDQADNYTRFLLIGQSIGRPSGHDKTAILFSVRDRVGALYDVLGVFARRRINLTRIESRPSRRQPWEYVFFVDFTGHPEEANAAAALEEMNQACTMVKVLGAWPTEQRVDDEPGGPA